MTAIDRLAQPLLRAQQFGEPGMQQFRIVDTPLSGLHDGGRQTLHRDGDRVLGSMHQRQQARRQPIAARPTQ